MVIYCLLDWKETWPWQGMAGRHDTDTFCSVKHNRHLQQTTNFAFFVVVAFLFSFTLFSSVVLPAQWFLFIPTFLPLNCPVTHRCKHQQPVKTTTTTNSPTVHLIHFHLKCLLVEQGPGKKEDEESQTLGQVNSTWLQFGDSQQAWPAGGWGDLPVTTCINYLTVNWADGQRLHWEESKQLCRSEGWPKCRCKLTEPEEHILIILWGLKKASSNQNQKNTIKWRETEYLKWT